MSNRPGQARGHPQPVTERRRGNQEGNTTAQQSQASNPRSLERTHSGVPRQKRIHRSNHDHEIPWDGARDTGTGWVLNDGWDLDGISRMREKMLNNSRARLLPYSMHRNDNAFHSRHKRGPSKRTPRHSGPTHDVTDEDSHSEQSYACHIQSECSDKENENTENSINVEDYAFTRQGKHAEKSQKHDFRPTFPGGDWKDGRDVQNSPSEVSGCYDESGQQKDRSPESSFPIAAAGEHSGNRPIHPCVPLCPTPECSSGPERRPKETIPQQREIHSLRNSNDIREPSTPPNADAVTVGHSSTMHPLSDTTSGVDTESGVSDWDSPTANEARHCNSPYSPRNLSRKVDDVRETSRPLLRSPASEESKPGHKTLRKPQHFRESKSTDIKVDSVKKQSLESTSPGSRRQRNAGSELYCLNDAPSFPSTSADAKEKSNFSNKTTDPRDGCPSAPSTGSQETACRNTIPDPSLPHTQQAEDISHGERSVKLTPDQTAETQDNKQKQASGRDTSSQDKEAPAMFPEREREKTNKTRPTQRDDSSKLRARQRKHPGKSQGGHKEATARQDRKDVNKEQSEHTADPTRQQRTDVKENQRVHKGDPTTEQRGETNKEQSEYKEDLRRQQRAHVNKEQSEHTGNPTRQQRTVKEKQSVHKEDQGRQQSSYTYKSQTEFGDKTETKQIKAKGDTSGPKPRPGDGSPLESNSSAESSRGMKQSQGKREDTMPSQATSRRNRMNSRSAPSSAHRSSSGKRVSERRQARLVTEMKRHVKMTYPDLQNRPYFIPPIHFNVSKRKHTPDTNGCYQAEKTPESNSRADEACERVLEVLKEALASRPVFVLSGITFEDYLNKRVPAARAGQAGGGSAQPVPIPLPRSADLPPQYRRGEVEMLVIDKDHGILIVDVKAVGDTFKEMKSNDSEKVEMISKVLEKALILMTKSKDVLLHLVSDIPATIPVKVMLVLPNLSKATLQNTLDKHSHLGEALGRCMEVGGPLTEACLCAEDLPLKHQPPTDHNVTHLADCWNRLYPRGQQVIDDDVYETIIGRFCGPFSTISVWTAQLPRREVRTLGQAVNETADRFATLLLLPQQQEVLKSEEPRVYLWGPPGAGKTLVLALKGIQWALEGAHVCVLTAKAGPSPIALVICKQIQKTLNQYHPNMDLGNVTTDNILIDQDVRRRDGTSLVGRLKAAAEGRPLGLILDEVHGEVLPYIRMLCAQLPAACRFWTSGPWPSSCPSGFAAHKLTTSVRCPPAVQALLKLTEPSGARSHGDGSEVTLERTTQYRYVTRGTMIDQYPLPTSGVPVTLLSHAGHGGEVPVLQCRLCAEALADHLLELGLGKDIQAQDVLILTADTDLVHQGLLASCTFVQVLQDQGFSLDVISDFPGCQERLAFPTNKITVTSYQFVTGLERSLVVFVPEGTSSDNSVASHVQVACDDDDSNSSTPQCPQNEVQFDAAELESIAPGNATPVLAPEGRHMEHREQDAPRNQAYHDEMGAEENGEVVGDNHQEKGQGTDQDKTEGICRENMQDVCRENREKEVCQDNSEKDRLENREKNRQEVSSSKTQEVRHENKEKSREVCEENQHEVSLNDRTEVCHENVEDSREEVRQKDMQEVCQENRPMVTEVNGHDVNHERKEGPIQTRRRDEQEKQTTGELDHQGNCSEDTHGDVNLNRQQVTQHSEHSASHGDRDYASENPAADSSRHTDSAGVHCLGKDSGGPAATMTAQGGKQTNFTRYGTLSNSDEDHANKYYNENHSLTKPPVRDLHTEHMDRELHDEEGKDVNNVTADSTDSFSSDNEQQFENRIQYDEGEGDSYIDIIDTIGNYSSGYDSDNEDDGRHSKTEDRPRKSPRDSYRTRRGGHIPRSEGKAYHLAVQQANAGDCYEVDSLFSEPCSPNPVRVLETDEENDADGLEQKAEDDTLNPTYPDDQQSVPTVTTQSPNHVDQSPQHAAAASEGSGLRPVTVQSLNSKLLAAVNSLSITNRENMWFSVSRSLGHCVVFHF